MGQGKLRKFAVQIRRCAERRRLPLSAISSRSWLTAMRTETPRRSRGPRRQQCRSVCWSRDRDILPSARCDERSVVSVERGIQACPCGL